MKICNKTFKYAGLLLCTALLLVACSKKGDGPDPEEPEKTQLLLEASATDIDEGDEVDFTITADGKAVDADIYVGDTKISGTKHKFTKTGVYQVTAKKEGYTDSGAEEVKVYKVEVYVAGTAVMAGRSVAVYWKNGSLKTLSKQSDGRAEANSIFVDKGDVYVAGYEYNGSRDVAKYWKNETGTDLTDGSLHAEAYSIFVDKGDVYIAGQDEYSSLRRRAKYWNLPAGEAGNGTEVNLTDGRSDAQAYSVFVDKGDLYVAGYYRNPSYTANYWKNGTAVDVTDGYSRGNAQSIFVDKGNVYVAGYEDRGNGVVAKYWRNGMTTDLTDGKLDAQAFSIFVDNGDVHVAGYESNGSTFVAKYWKNGTEVDLSDGSQRAQALSVFVDNGDVYVAGYENNGSKNVAKYWKNGKGIALDDGAFGTGAKANSIFVTRSIKRSLQK